MAAVTIRQSLLNLRTNIGILAFLAILLSTPFALRAPHSELIWSVAIILVVKAESRPQPRSVMLLAGATTLTALLAATNFRGYGKVAEGFALVLLVLLVLSKWLFSSVNG